MYVLGSKNFNLLRQQEIIILLLLYIYIVYRGCPGQFARTSTNPTGPEVNDHVSLQWPSYEQPQGSNLRPQREQTSWSQAFTTGSPPIWFSCFYICTG